MLSLFVTGIVYYVRRRLVVNEMAKMLWRVNYREIVWLNDKSRRSKSLGSLRTISTNASDETAEAIARGDKNVAHFRSVLVWAKMHQTSAVLSSESDHMHMKMVPIARVALRYALESTRFSDAGHHSRKYQPIHRTLHRCPSSGLPLEVLQ